MDIEGEPVPKSVGLADEERPNLAQLYPAHRRFKSTWTEPIAQSRHILIPDREVQSAAQALTMRNERAFLRPHLGQVDTSTEMVLRTLSVELEAGAGATSRLLVDQLCQSLCVLLLRSFAEEPFQSRLERCPDYGASHPSVRRAVESMHDQMAESLSLEDLASTAGVSRWHLTRLFRDAMGMPPHAYLCKIRVERAQQLLRNPNLSISAIAMDVGFCDQSHLNRHFKKIVGCTPAVFRRSLGGESSR